MKGSNLLKANVIAKTAVAVLALTQVACGNAVFSSNSSNQKAADTTQAAGDTTFITDSFERDSINFNDTVNNVFYDYSGFILDGANSFFAFTNNGAGATIPAAGVYGPAYDGKRFLLMSGRSSGSNVENVQVISQQFDLSAADTANINFHYLVFGNTNTTAKPTRLLLQICSGNLNQCGVNSDAPNAAALQSSYWTTVFDSNNDGKVWKGLNGQNHQVSDWADANVAIDLTDATLVPFPGAFTFRLVGMVHDEAPATTTGGSGTSDPTKCCKYGDYGKAYEDDAGSDNDNDELTAAEIKNLKPSDYNDDSHFDHSKPCHHTDDNGKPCYHKHCHHHPCPPKPPCDPTTPPTTTPTNTIQSGVAVDLLVGTTSTTATAVAGQ